MNCNTTHYRANSSSVPGDPTITNWELTIRGSNVGTRQDLNEAVAFAANGLVKAKIRTAALEDINAVFDEMRSGRIVGRVVLKLA